MRRTSMTHNDDHDPIASKASVHEETDETPKDWSNVVLKLLGIGTMIVGTSALTGCPPPKRTTYSRYCNACCRHYTTGSSYCNYSNYLDACC